MRLLEAGHTLASNTEDIGHTPMDCTVGHQGDFFRRAVNVPGKLLDALSQHASEHGSQPLLIHLSTDQVGSSSCPVKSDACSSSSLLYTSILCFSALVSLHRISVSDSSSRCTMDQKVTGGKRKPATL